MPTSHLLLFTLNRLPQHGRVPKWYLWANVNYANVPKFGEHLTTKYAFGPPLNSFSHGIEEGAPQRRDRSTPCLVDTRTSLLLVVLPHHEAKGLRAPWPSMVARKSGPREGGRIKSQSSALAMTKKLPGYPLGNSPPPAPPPYPGKWGGGNNPRLWWPMDTCSIMGSWPSWCSLLGEFCPTDFFSPVHFSWRTQPPRHLLEWCA